MIDNLLILVECLAVVYVVVRAVQLDRRLEWFTVNDQARPMVPAKPGTPGDGRARQPAGRH